MSRARPRTFAVLAAAAAALTVFSAQPAQAAPPARTTEVFPSSPQTGDHPFLDSACARLGIEVDADITFQFTEHVTTFFDASGNPVRLHIRQTLDATIFSVDDPGRALDVKAVRIVTEDLVDGTVRLNGLRFHYSAPGHGTLFLAAGHMPLVPMGEFRGRNDFGDPDAFRPVCEYLAGG